MNFRREAIAMAVWPLVIVLFGLALGLLGPRLFGRFGRIDRSQLPHERTESATK
jgi:hypothetical protein